MNCPYSDCTRQRLEGNEKRCPQCKSLLKACQHCREFNRAFSNHCRMCGRELTNAGQDWAGFKGGSERTSCNPSANGQALGKVKAVHDLTLEDRCKSLLSCDNHLIAVSAGGRIEVYDAITWQRKAGWKVDGPITCDPCVHRGSLYLGNRQGVVAYTLGAVATAVGSQEPR